MGVVGDNPDSDVFEESDALTDDAASLYVLCKFGPNGDGEYTESILSMLDYEMLCKAQKSSFCTCDVDKLYQIKAGEFKRYDAAEVTVNQKDKEDGTVLIAVIIASSAVVLVAIALILIIVLFICRARGGWKLQPAPAPTGNWPDRSAVQMGEPAHGEPDQAADNA